MTSENIPSNVPDYEKITRVIQLYAEGWKGDASKFREAFHEDAWIFFTDADGNLHKYLLADSFEGWAETNWEVEARILSVTQTGNIANVVMEFNNISDPSASFVDMHNLIKVNGVWKITNKTATHIGQTSLANEQA